MSHHSAVQMQHAHGCKESRLCKPQLRRSGLDASAYQGYIFHVLLLPQFHEATSCPQLQCLAVIITSAIA